VLFMKVLELRVKNRALRTKNCELVEDNRRLSSENCQRDRMMRRLISAAERVLPDRESSAPAYQNLRDAVDTARSFLGDGPRSTGAPDARSVGPTLDIARGLSVQSASRHVQVRKAVGRAMAWVQTSATPIHPAAAPVPPQQ
jgi:hypothetical protein